MAQCISQKAALAAADLETAEELLGRVQLDVRRNAHGHCMAESCSGSEPLQAEPSEEALHRLFDRLDVEESGHLGPAEVTRAVELLRSEGGGSWSSLPFEDTPQLYAFLCKDLPVASGVPRGRFVEGIRTFFGLLHRLNMNGFALQQMKVVLSAAFDRFDTDGDGSISLDEFVAAAAHMGMHLDTADAADLYSFLTARQGYALSQQALANEPQLVEKWATAIERCLKSFRRRKGIDGILGFGSRLQQEFAKGGSAQESLQRTASAAWSDIDEVCNIAALAVDWAGIAVAMGYLQKELGEAFRSQAMEALDLGELSPFLALIVLSVLSMARELNDLVPSEMSEDEAQLFGQMFYPRGFTQAEFRRLVSCPSFRRATAEPGEVLNLAGDETVKLVLRGSVEVRRMRAGDQQMGVVLPAGSSVGETSILKARNLWADEILRALEPVTYVSWDPNRLQETLETDTQLSVQVDGLMTETMVANLRAKVQALPGHPGLPPEAGQPSVAAEGAAAASKGPLGPTLRKSDLSGLSRLFQLDFGSDVQAKIMSLVFDALDTNKAGVVRTREFQAKLRALEGCLAGIPEARVLEAVPLLLRGVLSRGDLRALLRCVGEKLNLGDRQQDRSRLHSFFDAEGDGFVRLEDFQLKVHQIFDCFSCLQLSARELESTMHRAFRKFDANGDGAISQEEFVSVGERLKLPLTMEQMLLLHSYFDEDGDGFIDYSEWKDGGLGLGSWVEALKVALAEQAKRQGIEEFQHVMKQVYDVLSGPGDLSTKVAIARSKLWDSADSLFEVASTSGDLVGLGFAACCIWKEITGVASWQEVTGIDLSPFALFVSISAVSVLRHVAEGEVSDLSADEALLYATSFERKGFTVTEFRKLMTYGNAKWQEFPQGALMADASNSALRMVASGTCQRCCAVTQACTLVGRGGFLGGAEFLKIDMGEVSHAVEPSLVVTLDGDALKANLGHDESLTMRFNRMVTISMVDAVLGADLPASRMLE